MKKIFLFVVIILLFAGCSNNGRGPDLNEIRFEEVNLSDMDWEQVPHPAEPHGDWSPVVGQPFSTQEEAGRIANAILEIEQEHGFFPDFVLFLVRHDFQENIWIFIYGETTDPGADFCIAIHGDTGEVIQAWVQ